MKYAVRYTLNAIFFHAVRCTLYAIRDAIRHTKYALRYPLLYFLCKTNPILIRAKINLTLYIQKIYGNFTPLRTMKNKANTNPKQTQSNPISNGALTH